MNEYLHQALMKPLLDDNARLRDALRRISSCPSSDHMWLRSIADEALGQKNTESYGTETEKPTET